MDKKNIFLIFGGQSTEHEISCRSALTIYRNVDKTKYSLHTIGIDREGSWWLITPDPKDSDTNLVISKDKKIDVNYILGFKDPVVFPIIHGNTGEDGKIQGLCEFFNIACVGSSCLGSSIGMDKAISKKLVESAGIRVVPYYEIYKADWILFKKENKTSEVIDDIIKQLGLPLFVKPTSQGSSVGISKVIDKKALENACDLAFKFDTKLLVEKAFNVRELECAALGTESNPMITVAGEVITGTGFYDYEAKYISKTASTIQSPADLSAEQKQELKEKSKIIFKTLQLYGMSRIDFFLNKDDNLFYFNEVNTVPGFTSISQYPQLLKYEGVPTNELIDRLISLAEERCNMIKSLKNSV